MNCFDNGRSGTAINLHLGDKRLGETESTGGNERGSPHQGLRRGKGNQVEVREEEREEEEEEELKET